MTNKFTREQLVEWIESIIEAAHDDTSFDISWFGGTMDSPFSIIAGWKNFETVGDYSDLFCTSKSNPNYIMCIKIAINDGPYAYVDFEMMNMPLDKNRDVDDTCVPLEWDDIPEMVADFYMAEWERIMEAHGEEI
jgi:hypothetical protein